MRISFLFLLVCYSLSCFSLDKDGEFVFDTHFYDALNRWVIFPKSDDDSTYLMGFIYLDQQAGFTFQLNSHVKLCRAKLVKDGEDQPYHVKIRLGNNTANVAVLSDEQLNELELAIIPEWLSVYNSDRDSALYLKDVGKHLNGLGLSSVAIDYLSQAYSKDPTTKGLAFEIAYAYNATKQFERAISFLENAILESPNEAYLYRELGFAYVHFGDLGKAERIYSKVVELTQDSRMKSEVAINMVQAFFVEKDKNKFDYWANKLREFSKDTNLYIDYLDQFEKEF